MCLILKSSKHFPSSCRKIINIKLKEDVLHRVSFSVKQEFLCFQPNWSDSSRLTAETPAPRIPWEPSRVYLWAAVLASTTPAECIQERTASGSSFMLAVAPRGRLSWRPNISAAETQREKQPKEKSWGPAEKTEGLRDELDLRAAPPFSKNKRWIKEHEKDEKKNKKKWIKSVEGLVFIVCTTLFLFFWFISTFLWTKVK